MAHREGKLTEEQERTAIARMDAFYASVKVTRLDRNDGYRLRCDACRKEWDCVEETTPLYHWICPNRCNIDWLDNLFNRRVDRWIRAQ